jgi:hemerythrin-like domain-containing protein
VEYLDKEMDYIPRYAANKQLKYLDKMLSKSKFYGKFKVQHFKIILVFILSFVQYNHHVISVLSRARLSIRLVYAAA